MNANTCTLMIILAFTLLAAFLEIFVLYKSERSWGENSTKVVGLTIVVGAILAISIIGVSESGAALTILGTVAGYFLGQKITDDDSSMKKKKHKESSEQKKESDESSKNNNGNQSTP
jgi:hypothetical protein